MYGPVGIAFGILWLAWAASWIAAARWASKAAQRPALREETAYRVMTVAGGALMIIQFLPPMLPTLFWRGPMTLSWLLWVLACGGLGFTWWARIHLGTLWSGRVTRKDDHRIIDTGPYGIVRHPIYTGILTALYAGLLVDAGPINVLGVVVLTIAFVIKARLEERFLMQELGAEAYEGYRRRVPMLVPFWPRSR
jgi:protein-S-isoprenylcysteine O-methyltransferase Ste14